MALTVRLNGSQADKLIELVKEHKEKIQSGEITGFDQPVEREIADWDMILYALGEDDEDDEDDDDDDLSTMAQPFEV